MIIFALASFVLVGFVALSIDTGFLMAERRQVQSAADSAALAAAISMQDGKSSIQIQAAAVEYATSNAGVSASDVVVQHPPTSGPYAGDNKYIQVTVNKKVQKFFLGAVYNGNWAVSASAIAGLEPEGFDAALLALNSNSGGIETSGYTNIRVIGGSAVSNYNIKTSGDTTINADEYVVANDGFSTSGSTKLTGGKGVKPNGAEVPDPLIDKISPPTLPNLPGNSIPTASPPAVGACAQYNSWGNPTYTINPARYTSGGSGCVNPNGVPAGQTMTLKSGQWRFQNGAGISSNGNMAGKVYLEGGTFNFEGNGGIFTGGTTNNFEIGYGSYSFTGGARIDFSGQSPNNIIRGGNYYFTGGGGISAGGYNQVTIGPGTYIFNGGPGFVMSGNSTLNFLAGDYTFFFANGADFSFAGSSVITANPNAYVRAYFLGDNNNWSDLDRNGWSNMELPSGEYYFKRGRFMNSGSSMIVGKSVFLYFEQGSYLEASGSASFGFTAPTTKIYPGYYPGVFMYSNHANNATFKWAGNTASASVGTIYLPSSPVHTSGNSSGVAFRGQFIADRFYTSGNTTITVEFVEYVKTQIPKIYLVN